MGSAHPGPLRDRRAARPIPCDRPRGLSRSTPRPGAGGGARGAGGRPEPTRTSHRRRRRQAALGDRIRGLPRHRCRPERADRRGRDGRDPGAARAEQWARARAHRGPVPERRRRRSPGGPHRRRRAPCGTGRRPRIRSGRPARARRLTAARATAACLAAGPPGRTPRESRAADGIMTARTGKREHGLSRPPLDTTTPTLPASTSGPEAPAVDPLGHPPSAHRLLAVYWLLLAVATLVFLGRLLLGGLAFLAARSPMLREALTTPSPNPVVRGILQPVIRPEPIPQALVDFGFSLACLGLGVVILVTRRGVWSMRLLALALLALAGTSNLTVEVVARAVGEAVGATTGDVFLQSVALAAFLLALVTYPVVRPEQRGPTRREVLTVGLATVVLAALAATLLPPAVSYVLLFALVLPLAGLLLLRRRGRNELTADERTRLRLLLSVLVGTATVAVTLVVVTVATWGTGWHGLTLDDPTAPASEPELVSESALLFWFCRLMTVGLGVSALTAARRSGLYVTERRFSRSLVVAIVAALVGGLFVVVHTAIYQFAQPRNPSSSWKVLAIALAA